MQLGPCVICGDTNYELSCGGPSICPKCDCGNFDAATVQKQAKALADLRSENATLLATLKAQGEALEPFAREAAGWSPANGWSKDDPVLDTCSISGNTKLTVGDLRAARSAREAAPATLDIRWAVNVLLEKIAAKFDAHDTWDIWRSDAAVIVRSFKHNIEYAPATAQGETGKIEIEKHAELCTTLMDERPFSEKPWARMALAAAANAIRRGRLLTDAEKLENLAACFDEDGNPDTARKIRSLSKAE